MSIYYAGVGSRHTPHHVCRKMTKLARQLRAQGFILRSGGAFGADAAFAMGADKDAEIFLPWEQYNRDEGTYRHGAIVYKGVCNDAIRIAKKFHPMYDTLPNGAQKLMARNSYQILGVNLDTPVKFVICWSPSDRTGGTSQAVRIANHHNIPVYNLHDRDVYNTIEDLVSSGELSS